jgi:Leucine-rich repeat (LRR) protein
LRIAEEIRLHVDNTVGEMNGKIPDSLYNLKQLWLFSISGHAFEGEIKTEIGKLEKLMYLHLDRNKFTGPLPSELGKLEKLTELYLDSNQFTGTLPSELGLCVNLGTRCNLEFNFVFLVTN